MFVFQISAQREPAAKVKCKGRGSQPDQGEGRSGTEKSHDFFPIECGV